MAERQYRPLARLEAGGMAEVFVAEQSGAEGFRKRVAIKRVLPHLAENQSFIKMFLDEARLGARLSHTNIVSVSDIGSREGEYFIVMEFVDGLNLKAVIESLRKQGRRFPLKEAIWICIEACKGLSYAHEATDDDGRELGIVHRDISPPNLLISKRGEVKVTDFGLAKAVTQLEKTDPGVVKGKFSYLAPEAALGQPVDARADVFAMGIVLWEMLAGRRLFLGETDYQTVKLVQQANVPAITKINAEADDELEGLLAKALARDVRDRYQSARELGDALASYLFGRQLKVTSFDVQALVRTCLAEQGTGTQSQSIIDKLIQEELLRFTSLDEASDPSQKSLPKSAQDAREGAVPLDAGLFENPAEWFADDASRTSLAPPRSVPPRGPTTVPPVVGGAGAQSEPDLAALLEADELRSRDGSVPLDAGGAVANRRDPSVGFSLAPRDAPVDASRPAGAPPLTTNPPLPTSGSWKYIVLTLLLIAGAGVVAFVYGVPH